MGMSQKTKMTRKDYAWRRMDSDSNLMVINCVLMFDGNLDFARLTETIGKRITDYPRFIQKIVLDRGCPYWQEDASFQISSHLTLAPMAQRIDEENLQHHITAMANVPLDPGRPQWNMTVFDKVGKGFAILFRLHHCVTDGLGLVHILNHLTCDDNDAISSAMSHPRHAKGGDNIVSSAAERVRHWLKVVGHLARLSLLPRDGKTRLKRSLGGEKKLVWLPPIALERVKAVAAKMRVSVNDVWIAAVAGALRQYLSEQGDRIDGRSLRAAVTFNLRDERDAFKLGNEFTLVALDLPTIQPSPRARLQQVSRGMAAIKRSYQPQATMAFLSLAGCLPGRLQRFSLDLFTSKASVIITNLAGPRTQRCLAGASMTAFHCWVPQSGRLGVGFSFMSYVGQVRLGLYVDKQLIDAPERMMNLTLEAFNQLADEAGADAISEHRLPAAARHGLQALRPAGDPVGIGSH